MYSIIDLWTQRLISYSWEYLTGPQMFPTISLLIKVHVCMTISMNLWYMSIKSSLFSLTYPVCNMSLHTHECHVVFLFSMTSFACLFLFVISFLFPFSCRKYWFLSPNSIILFIWSHYFFWEYVLDKIP